MIEHYLHFSVAIGLGQVADAIYLGRLQGRITRFAMIFSLLEYVWAAVSAWVFFKQGPEAPQPLWYPAAFISYVVVMTLWSIVFAFRTDCENVEDLENLAIPPAILQTGGLFGALFAGAGIVLLLRS